MQSCWFEGIPGIYIHSLLGTQNDLDKVANTGQTEALIVIAGIFKLKSLLDDASTHHHQVFTRLSQLIRLRSHKVLFTPTRYNLRCSLVLRVLVFGDKA